MTEARATASAGRARPAVHVVLLVTQVAFASLAVEGKLAMSPAFGVSPKALAMARIVGGALVFLVLQLVSRGPRVRSLLDVGRLALLSIFGIVLNQTLFLAGLERTSPVAATLLVATVPVFSAIVAALFGRDRVTARTAAGIALALVGVFVLTHFMLPRAGDALVLLNSLCYSIYLVFAKGVLERYGTTTVIAWIFGLGAILFAPFGGASLLRELPAWHAGAASLVAFVVLVPTVVAYSFNAWALERARPTLVAMYVYLQPLVVVALAWVQLGQRLDAWTAMAGLLIFAGVGVVATAKRAPPVRAAP